jgi:DNA-binding protein H-NS
MSTEIDLYSMDLKDLKDLHKNLGKAIASYEERQLKAARAALEEHAKSFGISLEDVMGTKIKRARNVVAAKYRHPENPDVTWSGRGRKPAWIKEAEEAGQSLEEFAV